MISGIKNSKEVAQFREDAFIGEKTKKKMAERLEEAAKINETGFYDQMKKNISKDAHEECRFCHKKKAYCE